jgi:hypothetical protein
MERIHTPSVVENGGVMNIMSNEEKNALKAKEFRKQIGLPVFRQSLQTRYGIIPTNAQFDDLLKRLEDAEGPKSD